MTRSNIEKYTDAERERAQQSGGCWDKQSTVQNKSMSVSESTQENT